MKSDVAQVPTLGTFVAFLYMLIVNDILQYKTADGYDTHRYSVKTDV